MSNENNHEESLVEHKDKKIEIEISTKIETFLENNFPELYRFYKPKAIYNECSLFEIIIKTLIKEYEFSKDASFKDAMN